MPPAANAEVVWAREDPLAVDPRPDDAPRPLVGVEEGTTPLGQAIRTPLPAAAGRPERLDDEDERQGTGHLCMRFAPLAGRREGLVPGRRIAVDDAAAIQHLVDVSSPRAETIVLRQDHLHTHTRASRYEACSPEAARRLLDKRAGHDTPKPGRGLHMAAIAWGVWRGQGLDRRLPDFPTFTSEVTAWQRARHAAQVKVDWPFTTADARVKLTRLDPILKPVKNTWTNH